MAAPQTQMDIRQQNAMARAAVLASSVEMTQQIFATTVVPATTNTINVVPRNVGLIKGFWVRVDATVTNTAGAATLLTDFNIANIISNFTFTDLNNNQRINTTGWHLQFLDTVKGCVYGPATGPRAAPFASALSSDSPIKYGSIVNVQTATASIAASGSGTIRVWYWVPLAYSDGDLRGAVYANVVNATMNLQMTINPQATIASGDSTSAVYSGNAASVTSATITVYQNYLDQLPMSQNGPVLPLLDLSTVYELKQTALTGVVANQEFPIAYSNFRDFLSTVIVYYNGSARTAGTDTAYHALQSANYTNIFKQEPTLTALKTRQIIDTDLPLGTFYFDYRGKPISTVQYGNMQLILNASTATAGAYVLAGFESFAMLNTVVNAGSLAAN